MARFVAIRTYSSSLLAIRSLSPTCNAQRKRVHERKQGGEKGMGARERAHARAARAREREKCVRVREKPHRQTANENLRAYKSLLNLCQY